MISAKFVVVAMLSSLAASQAIGGTGSGAVTTRTVGSSIFVSPTSPHPTVTVVPTTFISSGPVVTATQFPSSAYGGGSCVCVPTSTVYASSGIVSSRFDPSGPVVTSTVTASSAFGSAPGSTATTVALNGRFFRRNNGGGTVISSTRASPTFISSSFAHPSQSGGAWVSSSYAYPSSGAVTVTSWAPFPSSGDGCVCETGGGTFSGPAPTSTSSTSAGLQDGQTQNQLNSPPNSAASAGGAMVAGVVGAVVAGAMVML